jgi:hypothetical protein
MGKKHEMALFLELLNDVDKKKIADIFNAISKKSFVQQRGRKQKRAQLMKQAILIWKSGGSRSFVR